MVAEDALITLTSSDNQDIQITVKAARGSRFIVDTLCLDDEGAETELVPIEITKVDSNTLKKIVEFLNEYSEHPFPSIQYDSFKAKSFTEIVSHPYYITFIESLEEGTGFSDVFYQVKGGANYMNVTPLLEMICAYMVYKCEKIGNGPAVRALLKLPPMNPEELKNLRREQPWMFSKEDDELFEKKVEKEQ